MLPKNHECEIGQKRVCLFDSVRRYFLLDMLNKKLLHIQKRKTLIKTGIPSPLSE